jgi:acyl carrier protein
MSNTVCANTKRVRQALVKSLGRDGMELDDNMVLTDLVAESFALIETVINLQEKLKIRLVQDDLRDVKTVGDLLSVCAKRL